MRNQILVVAAFIAAFAVSTQVRAQDPPTYVSVKACLEKIKVGDVALAEGVHFREGKYDAAHPGLTVDTHPDLKKRSEYASARPAIKVCIPNWTY